MAKATSTKTKKAEKEPPQEMAQQESTAVELVTTSDESASLEKMKMLVMEKFSLPHSQIAQWKQDFALLNITGIDDKEGWQKVYDASRLLVKARTSIDDKYEVLNRPLLNEQNILRGVQKDLKTLVAEVETPLKAKLDLFKQWETEAAEKKEREDKARLDDRVNELLKAGIVYSNGYYCIGEIATDISTIKTLSDGDYEILLAKVQFANTKILAEKAEQKRLDDEKAEQEKADREKLAADQKKLDDDKVELAQKQKDFEDQQNQLRLDKIKMRQQRLESIGLSYKTSLDSFTFENPYYDDCGIVGQTMKICSDEDFEQYFSGLQRQVEAIKARKLEDDEKAEQQRKDDEEKQRAANENAAKLYQSRVNQLASINMLFTNGSNQFIYQNGAGSENQISIPDSFVKQYSDEGFETVLQGRKDMIAAYEQNKKNEEANRLMEMESAKPEIQKAKEYFNKLLSIDVPILSNEKLAEMVADTRKAFGSSIESHLLEIDKMLS